MNPLIQDLVDRLHRNDPSLGYVCLRRLPLFSVKPHEVKAVISALGDNTLAHSLDLWLPAISGHDCDDSQESTFDSGAKSKQYISKSDDYSCLTQVLQRNKSLKYLVVSSAGNALAWQALFQGLKGNSMVQRLELGDASAMSSRGLIDYGGTADDRSSDSEFCSCWDTDVCLAVREVLEATQCPLKILILRGLTVDDPDAMETLCEGFKANRSLQTVELHQLEFFDDEDLTAQLFQAFRDSHIHTLGLVDCDLDQCNSFPSLLDGNRTLRTLRLIDCQLDTKAVRSLAASLQTGNKDSALKVLDIRGNAITASHCEHLAGMLGSNVGLERIVLEENSIGDRGLKKLLKGIGSSSLVKLNLRSTGITGTGIQALAAVLANTRNPEIQHLDLSENRLSDSGAAALGAMLKENSSLSCLELESCGISDDGLQKLSNGLADNSSLCTIRLNQNRVGKIGAESLSKMLETNKSLRILELSSCEIADDAAAVLARGLRLNDTLKKLSLSFNEITDGGLGELGCSLPRSGLEKLEVQFNNFGPRGLRQIVSGLSQNTSLKDLAVLSTSLFCSETENLVEEMQHWLRLNRAGRRAVAAMSMQGERSAVTLNLLWPTVIVKADKVYGANAVFYILRESLDAFDGLHSRQGS